MANSIIELYTQVPADLEGNVFGQFDEHLKLIERTLNVTLISRDGMLKILGTEQSATQAKKLIEELVTLAGRGNTRTRQNVSYALSLAMEERNQVLTEIDKDFICNTIQGRPIKPKTLGQQEYVEQIRKKMIVATVMIRSGITRITLTCSCFMASLPAVSYDLRRAPRCGSHIHRTPVRSAVPADDVQRLCW